MPNQTGPGHDHVCTILSTLLRGALQKGQNDDVLQTATGIPARTVKSYRIDGKEPSLSTGLALLGALGPDAVNAMLSTIGYTGAKPIDGADTLDPRQLVAQILPHVATIATAAADGRIDHNEGPGCTQAADCIIATVLPLSSMASGN